jgi:hypothetical protein
VSASANGFHRSTLWERVTSEEYKGFYTEALDVVQNKIGTVGEPRYRADWRTSSSHWSNSMQR